MHTNWVKQAFFPIQSVFIIYRDKEIWKLRETSVQYPQQRERDSLVSTILLCANVGRKERLRGKCVIHKKKCPFMSLKWCYHIKMFSFYNLMRVKVAKCKAKRIKGAFNFLVMNSQKCKENTCQFDRKPKGKSINLAVIKPPHAAWLVCDDEVLLVLH